MYSDLRAGLRFDARNQFAINSIYWKVSNIDTGHDAVKPFLAAIELNLLPQTHHTQHQRQQCLCLCVCHPTAFDVISWGTRCRSDGVCATTLFDGTSRCNRFNTSGRLTANRHIEEHRAKIAQSNISIIAAATVTTTKTILTQFEAIYAKWIIHNETTIWYKW